MFLKSRCVQKS